MGPGLGSSIETWMGAGHTNRCRSHTSIVCLSRAETFFAAGCCAKQASAAARMNTDFLIIEFFCRLLHHWSDAPRYKLVMAENLSLRSLSGSGPKDCIENFTANFLDGPVAVGDRAGIDVHVVGHAAERGCVARNFDDGNGRKTDRAAAASGEYDHVAAARGKSRERSGIVSRSVHKVKARNGDAFGVIDRVGESGTARLRYRAERLL